MWFEKIDCLTDLESIGQILYTNYVVQFLISGLILLLSVTKSSLNNKKSDNEEYVGSFLYTIFSSNILALFFSPLLI